MTDSIDNLLGVNSGGLTEEDLEAMGPIPSKTEKPKGGLSNHEKLAKIPSMRKFFGDTLFEEFLEKIGHAVEIAGMMYVRGDSDLCIRVSLSIDDSQFLITLLNTKTGAMVEHSILPMELYFPDGAASMDGDAGEWTWSINPHEGLKALETDLVKYINFWAPTKGTSGDEPPSATDLCDE